MFTATASVQTAPHPSGAFKNRICRLAKLVTFVREANRNEVLEELVKPLDVARRVGRKVTRPLDGPLEGGIRAARAVEELPPRRFENQEGFVGGCSLYFSKDDRLGLAVLDERADATDTHVPVVRR